MESYPSSSEENHDSLQKRTNMFYAQYTCLMRDPPVSTNVNNDVRKSTSESTLIALKTTKNCLALTDIGKKDLAIALSTAKLDRDYGKTCEFMQQNAVSDGVADFVKASTKSFELTNSSSNAIASKIYEEYTKLYDEIQKRLLKLEYSLDKTISRISQLRNKLWHIKPQDMKAEIQKQMQEQQMNSKKLKDKADDAANRVQPMQAMINPSTTRKPTINLKPKRVNYVSSKQIRDEILTNNFSHGTESECNAFLNKLAGRVVEVDNQGNKHYCTLNETKKLLDVEKVNAAKKVLPDVEELSARDIYFCGMRQNEMNKLFYRKSRTTFQISAKFSPHTKPRTKPRLHKKKFIEEVRDVNKHAPIDIDLL